MGRRRRGSGSSACSRTIRASAWRATRTRGTPRRWPRRAVMGSGSRCARGGPATEHAARRGRELAEVEVLRDAAVLLEGDRIAAVGPYKDLRRATGNVQRGGEVVEVAGVLFPGFVDCHTHAVFGAPRLEDHERRALGEDYKTVAARGGGILQSVRDVRARSESELVALMRARVRALLAHGSTTIEVKSGYGLDPENELKQLRAIRATATA